MTIPIAPSPREGRGHQTPPGAITVTSEIHPALGIARVGSSRLETEHGDSIGPDSDGAPPACSRDPAGDLRRQVARFRVVVCRRDEPHRLIDATEVTRGLATMT
jgi:hypothetical protein